MRYSGSFAVLFVMAFVALGLRPEAEAPHPALDIAVTDVYDAAEARAAETLCTVDCRRPVLACGQCAHKPTVGASKASA